MGYPHKQRSPNFLAPGASFVEDSFSRPGRGGMVWVIQVHHIYCALYFQSSATADLTGTSLWPEVGDP